MTTLFGFASQHDLPAGSEVLRAMAGALDIPGNPRRQLWLDAGGRAGVGTMTPGSIPDPGQIAVNSEAGVRCFFDGIVHRPVGALEHDQIEAGGADLLLSAYLESGLDCLKTIDGSFSVAWWHEDLRRLVIGGDRVGQMLLFYGCRNGTIVFGSYLAQVMAARQLSTSIDVEGLADLLACEYILGERTLFKDVQVLAPGSCLIFEHGRVQRRHYWRIDEIDPRGVYDDDRLDELVSVWKLAVRRSVNRDLKTTIGMTGGIDSRMILAAASAQDLGVSTYTGGASGSTDVILARQASELVGARHTFRSVEPGEVGRWLEPMVRYHGGLVATLHSHPCRILYSDTAEAARIQGIGGEYLRGFWTARLGEKVSTPSERATFLTKRVVTSRRMTYLRRIWRPEYKDMAVDAPRAHLDAAIRAYDTRRDFLSHVHWFYLHERCRKFLNKGVMISRIASNIFLPYLDPKLIETVTAIPVSQRLRHGLAIQIDVIRRLCPRLLDVPYAKDLLPLSTPKHQRWIVHTSREVRRRLHRKLKFINPPPRSVKNHDYAHWIREDMRPAIMALLSDPDAAFRDYLDTAAVQSLLARHLAGQSDYRALIAALVTFELAQKLWATSPAIVRPAGTAG